MPAYTQASGAGAAQPIQPATASNSPRGIIPGVGVVGGGEATKEEIFGRGRNRPRIKNEKDPGGLFSPEYSARVLEEGRKNPSSPFYQREYTAEERAQSERNITADKAQAAEVRKKSGLSDEAYSYLESQAGRIPSSASDTTFAAPTYDVYKNLADNSGGRLDASQAEYDRRVKEQQAVNAYMMNNASPGMRAPSKRGTRRFFDFSDYRPDAALSGFYSTPQRTDALIARLG
jgi:hypothetical protein